MSDPDLTPPPIKQEEPMNTKWRFAAILLASLAMAFGTTGCDDALNGNSETNTNQEPDNQTPECTDDEGCTDGICIDSMCVETCSDAETDCEVDQECVERPDGGDEQICEDIPYGQSCTENEECRTDEFCNTGEGVCVPTGSVSYHTVLIQDVTPDFGLDERCTDTTMGYNTSGVKVFDIILYSGETPIAFAEAVDFRAGWHGENEEDDLVGFGDDQWLNIFDGEPNDFTHFCPDETEMSFNDTTGDTRNTTFRDDMVLALGCNGQLFVQLIDDTGTMRELEHGVHSLDIYVYGQECSDEWVEEWSGTDSNKPQTVDDPYDVYLCEYAGGGPVNNPEEVCTVRLNADPITGHTRALEIDHFAQH